MALRAYNIETGEEVHCGDTVTSFRDAATATLKRLDRANEIGRDGKVTVTWEGDDQDSYYYARVFGLAVRDRDE